jgi:predicted DNA-binding protein (UPF0251 family)
MRGEITQVGLRLSETRNAYLDDKAQNMGISKNALINILIELGIKLLDSDITINLNPRE